MVAHASHHIEINHSHNTIFILGEVDALVIILLHPFQEILGADQTLFLGAKEDEDDASFRANLFKKLGQFKHYGITTGIVVSTRVNGNRVRTA